MKHISVLSTAALLAAGASVACGQAPSSPLSGQDMMLTSAMSVSNDVCDKIWADLELSREMLAQTDAWRDLEQTEAYKVFGKSIKRASEAHCTPFNPRPSPVCEAVDSQIRTAWRAVTETDAFKIAERLPVYGRVRNGYAALRTNKCWEQMQ